MLGLGASLSNLYVPQGGSYINEYSIEFDGTNDYFDTNSTFQTTLRGSYTIAFWLNSTAALPSGGVEQYFFGMWEFGSPYSRMYMTTNSSGRLGFLMEAEGSGTLNCSSSGTTAINDGEWMHIAVVVTKVGGSSNSTGKIYINGVEDISSSSSSMTGTEQEGFDADGKKLFFGYLNAGGGINSFFGGRSGKWDEIAIWNTALSANSLAVVGDSPFDLTTENGDYAQQGNLVSYWKFTEGSGTSAEDATGNSDGTLKNGLSFSSSTP